MIVLRQRERLAAFAAQRAIPALDAALPREALSAAISCSAGAPRSDVSEQER
jgi:hypothetical protein